MRTELNKVVAVILAIGVAYVSSPLKASSYYGPEDLFKDGRLRSVRRALVQYKQEEKDSDERDAIRSYVGERAEEIRELRDAKAEEVVTANQRKRDFEKGNAEAAITRVKSEIETASLPLLGQADKVVSSLKSLSEKLTNDKSENALEKYFEEIKKIDNQDTKDLVKLQEEREKLKAEINDEILNAAEVKQQNNAGLMEGDGEEVFTPSEQEALDNKRKLNEKDSEIADLETKIAASQKQSFNDFLNVDIRELIKDEKKAQAYLEDLVSLLSKVEAGEKTTGVEGIIKDIKDRLEKIKDGYGDIKDLTDYVAELKAVLPENDSEASKKEAEKNRKASHRKYTSELNKKEREKTALERELDKLVDLDDLFTHVDEGNYDGDIDKILTYGAEGRHKGERSLESKNKDIADVSRGLSDKCLDGTLTQEDLDAIKDDVTRNIVKQLDARDNNLAQVIAGLSNSINGIQNRLNQMEFTASNMALQLQAQAEAPATWKAAGSTDTERTQNLNARLAALRGPAQQAILAATQAQNQCQANQTALAAAQEKAGPNGEVDSALSAAAASACQSAQQLAQAAQTSQGEVMKIEAALAYGAANASTTNIAGASAQNAAEQMMQKMRDMLANTSTPSTNNNGGLTINTNGSPSVQSPNRPVSLSNSFGRDRGSRFSRDRGDYRRSDNRRSDSRANSRRGKRTRSGATFSGRANRTSRR